MISAHLKARSSGNSFYIMAKLRKPIHFSQKGQNVVIFRDLKLSDGKTKITNLIFLKEILKAVCLSFDWVPKLIQKCCYLHRPDDVFRLQRWILDHLPAHHA